GGPNTSALRRTSVALPYIATVRSTRCPLGRARAPSSDHRPTHQPPTVSVVAALEAEAALCALCRQTRPSTPTRSQRTRRSAPQIHLLLGARRNVARRVKNLGHPTVDTIGCRAYKASAPSPGFSIGCPCIRSLERSPLTR